VLTTSLGSAWLNHLRPIHPGYVHLRTVETREITASGAELKNEAGAFVGQGFAGNVASPGTSAFTAVYPPQTALVVSLVTGRAGPTGKGRFYLPPVGFALQTTDFMLSESNRTTVLTAVQGFLNAVVTTVGMPLSVFSSKNYSSPVTGVKIGRTLDSQRSRRRSMTEGYGSTVSVNQPA
jgi:hypothetical protein